MALSQVRSHWSTAIPAFFGAITIASAHVIPRQISSSELLPSYDYVIVGGGTAGLTVADRLTENPETTVPVLEAGGFGDPDNILHVNLTTRNGTVPIWPGILSVPQTNLGNATNQVRIAQVVGGGSAVNGMVNMRGSADDYNRWDAFFEEAGEQQPDWSWHGILPYFKKGLHFTPPPPELTKEFDISYDASYWGDSSEMYAGWPSFYWPGVKPMFNAFREIPGVEFPVDGGAGGAGVYWNPTLMDPRSVTRSYAGSGHYYNVKDARPNYHLLINTKVRKVLINSTSKDATGVEFQVLNSPLQAVSINKEVILSAGAIHSPQLLQLSGVGPKALLDSAGIEVLVDLPGVGQTFQDHGTLANAVKIMRADMAICYSLVNGLTSIHPSPNDLTRGTSFWAWAEEVFAANKTDPFSIALTNLCAWLPMTVNSDKYDELATKLEVQDHASLLPSGTHPTLVAGFKAQMQALAAQMRSKDTIFMRMQLLANQGSQGPVFMQSFSRGTVNMNTTDPWNTEPIVDYRALSNPVETEVAAEVIHFVRRYSFNTTLADTMDPTEQLPGADLVSDEDLKAYVHRSLIPTDLHPVGTCAMMQLELGGVVDRDLRVYGVGKLRIVDASIMSMLPGANTCQPTYAIAEKAADIIKQANWNR